MSCNGEGILADETATDEEFAEAMGRAIQQAMLEHQRAGVPIAVWDWENDRVVTVPSQEIVIPAAAEDQRTDVATEANP